MKVMQVNVVYPNGSTGKIVSDIHNALIFNNHESLVCYGRGENYVEQNVYKITSEMIMRFQSIRAQITGYTYGGCFISTRKLLNIIRIMKPDIVHIHCINGYMVNIYSLLDFLKQNNIATVLTLHAEFMYTAGCGHSLDCEKWKTGCGKCPQRKNGGRPASRIFDRSSNEWELMKKSFDGFENLIITSVSPWLNNRAKLSPFFRNKELRVVLNGIDTSNVFKPTDLGSLKNQLSLKNEKIVLHVTSNFTDPIKGGNHVLEIARRLENFNIKFIIVGLNSEIANLPNNIICLPIIRNQKDLAALYSIANITLITSIRETFSMVCAESLSCGTPVVGFEAGGPESISLTSYSEFVKQGDIDSLERAIMDWLYNREYDKTEIVQLSRKYYSKEIMYNSYLKIYKELFKE